MAKQIETLTSDQEKIIYRQLGKYCAYRERAESEVWNKLKELEVAEQLSFKLIALLKKDKFLNNRRFARFYATGKFSNNKWGKIKIRQGLREKKISSADINFAMNKINDKEYEQTINKLIEKKAALLKDKQLFVFRKKIVDSLRIKGYEADIAWDMVKAKFPDK
ncbi:MAG: regulatory protein RecX [Chitinophagales bacterium]